MQYFYCMNVIPHVLKPLYAVINTPIIRGIHAILFVNRRQSVTNVIVLRVFEVEAIFRSHELFSSRFQ